MKYNPVDVARQYLFVREAGGDNRGLRVEAIQHWSAGQFGDSWCAEFATMVLDICFEGDAPIPRQGSCATIKEKAELLSWLTDSPMVGDLFLYVNEEGHAHHIGFVTNIDPLTGIAGNTSPDGKSSNGDGVHEHPINTTVFVHYPA